MHLIHSIAGVFVLGLSVLPTQAWATDPAAESSKPAGEAEGDTPAPDAEAPAPEGDDTSGETTTETTTETTDDAGSDSPPVEPPPAPEPAEPAAPPTSPPAAEPAAAPSTAATPSAPAPPTRPMYMAVRGSIAVPPNTNGDVKSAGVGFGVDISEPTNSTSYLVGMRVIYIPEPPENPLTTENPDVSNAWGPVFDGTVVFDAQQRLAFYLTGALGFVYGVPEDPEAGNNVILPILNMGFGGQLSKTLSSGSRLFTCYELGLVPGAAAPYTAVSMGVLLPGS